MSDLSIKTLPHAALSVPASLAGLDELALNLRWTWDPATQAIFRDIDPWAWQGKKGPVAILHNRARLDQLSQDEAWIKRVAEAVADLRCYLGAQKPEGDPTAYFCAEFGLHETFALYSGGLGILAGDHCKEASDLSLPFVAIGLFYRRGFFNQVVDASGRQEHMAPTLDPSQLPVTQVADPATGEGLVVQIPLPDRVVFATVWLAQVGRIPLLLLDTDREDNEPEDRKITSQLYTSGREMRLCQEVILGVGGVKALSALGINPKLTHMNEGHSALLLVERLRELCQTKGLAKAKDEVKATSILTIHTPVAAGNERFESKMMRKYLAPLVAGSKVRVKELEAWAVDSEGTAGVFDMTALALRLSRLQNGVSLLHGRTADGTWRKVAGQEVIGLTNGVHMPTWLGPEIRSLCESLGATFHHHTHFDKLEASDWRGILAGSEEAVWQAHTSQKARLMDFASQRIFDQRARHGVGPDELKALREMLDPEAFTIGFARRFATYKRAHLLFSNPKALARILGNSDRPVQVIFAGKAHPADRDGQALIAQIFQETLKHKGKIFFLEDYDMETGRMLVQGVDIWLNNPRRPLEASGTSGMKAAANGVPNVSILDGWWDEAAREGARRNGWAIGDRTTLKRETQQDKIDAAALYDVLENQVIPLYFDRNKAGLPKGWVKVMQESIASSIWQFSTARMLLEYEDRMVRP